MSDWHLDDKDWVKQRKKAWREVKANIDAFSEGWLNIDKEEKKQNIGTPIKNILGK